MQNDIVRLIELQKLDLEILKLERSMAEVPEALKKVKEKKESLEGKLANLTAIIEEKEAQRKLFEEELKEEIKRLKQTQARLTQIRGTREYQILLAEIEEIKRTNKQKEEEILKLMEEVEKLTVEKNKIEEELNKITQIFDEENKKFEELCQKLKEEIAKLTEKRAQMTKKVSSGILRKYEMIRQKKGGIGIAPVDNGVCEGCHMAIPPQLYIEIQKDKRFHECPHCKRIIYFKRYYHQEPLEEPNLKEAKASS